MVCERSENQWRVVEVGLSKRVSLTRLRLTAVNGTMLAKLEDCEAGNRGDCYVANARQLLSRKYQTRHEMDEAHFGN